MTRWTKTLALFLLVGTPAALAQDGEDSGGEQGDRPTTVPQVLAQPSADAQDARTRSPDAMAVLMAASEAVKGGFAAEIKTHLESDSAMAGMFPVTEGRWMQKALGEDGQWAVRHIGYGTVSQGKEQVDFDMLWQPDRVTWLDHEAKLLYMQPLRRGNKPGSAHQLGNSPWDRAEPLADGFASAMANAASIDIRDRAEIDGRAYDVVSITQKENADSVLWYFDRETHLPRRCEILLPDNPMLSGAMRVDFLNAVAGPEAAPEAEFQIQAPEGYAESLAAQFRVPSASAQEHARGNVPPVRSNPEATGLPDWEVADTEGAMISPGSLKGQVSVLYFWGTWSAPAKKFTPEVKALAEHYAGKPVEVIGMAFRENDPSAVQAAAEEQGQAWRQVPKADDAASVLGVRMAPALVVLGKEGELLYKSGRPTGDTEAQLQRVRAIIDNALTAEPGSADSKARPAAATGQEAGARGVEKAGRPAKIIKKGG